VGLETTRCNLVVALDPPKDFLSFAFERVKARSRTANVLYFSPEGHVEELQRTLDGFLRIERRLLAGCAPTMVLRGKSTAKDMDQSWLSRRCSSTTFKQVTLANALFHINRYCAKLPSDTFTRLTPAHVSREVILSDGRSAVVCSLLLPVNSPLRTVIHSPPMPNEGLAARAAALEAMRRLHALREVDDGMVPVGKEGPKVTSSGARSSSKESSTQDNR